MIRGLNLHFITGTKMDNPPAHMPFVHVKPTPAVNGQGDVAHPRIVVRRAGYQVHPVAARKQDASRPTSQPVRLLVKIAHLYNPVLKRLLTPVGGEPLHFPGIAPDPTAPLPLNNLVIRNMLRKAGRKPSR